MNPSRGPMLPKEALKRLIEGNQRYVNDSLEHPNRNAFRREEVRGQQKPFAVIVGCSDSRVPPEIIFDQGLGDLFTIRVAGNVIGSIEKESLDFAVHALGVSLIMVLGHESCGAVTAVYEKKQKGIEALANLIEPSIQGAKTLKEAVFANIQGMCKALKESSSLKDLLNLKKVEVVGSYYHLRTGAVEVLSE